MYVRCIKALNKANKQHRTRSSKQVASRNVACFYYWRNGGYHMRITTYRSEINEYQHNILVKENSCNYPVDSLRSPQAVSEMLNTVFRLNKQAEEYVYMIALNTKSKPLGVFEISHGSVSQSICNPREIFIKALLCGATGIILAHNHPSGDTTPSNGDMAVYDRIKEAGKIMGVSLLDNIIVGNGYFSFMENGI